MRRAALALVAVLCLAAPVLGEEHISSFDTRVELDVDGSFTVEERILYSFGGAKKHGIYRDIPVRYGRGSAPDYRIALEVESVTDANGEERPFKLMNEGEYRRIRIGSKSRKVTGQQEYRIRYRVERGILWLAEHDELYWNATGTEWKVPIDRAEVTVTTPADRDAGATRALCFTGRMGSVETACAHASDGRMTYLEAKRPLGAREGLTVVVALPKGLLDEPGDLAKWLQRASDYVSWATLMPFAVFFGMGWHWWRHGRDPVGPFAIPVRYEPPEGMTPAEMGTVLDESVDLRDITATILDMAVRGHLRIEETEAKGFLFLSETDYVLHRRSASGGGPLKEHEETLLDGLFGSDDSVELSSLKEKFYTKLPSIQKALYEEVSREGRWFPARPDEVRERYTWIALAIAVPLAVLAFFLQAMPLLLSMVACAAIALFWARFMPRRTGLGRRARQHILGFREFVERVERDRLERLGLHSVEQFEKLLPYAFVLGVADAWAEAFADLYREPPEWFHSHSGDRFRASRLVDRVGHAMDTAGSVMSSTPNRGSGSSGFGGGGGGGGFSGGGFGGGGGGSW